MFGLVLTAIGSFFEEVSDVIGKEKMEKKEEGIYTMAFLSLFWGIVLFGFLILVKDNFIFRAASLPFFITRVFFEIIQVHVTVSAIAKADRSTFSFIRTGTLPLLLMVDLALGYSLSLYQILGVAIIVGTLFFALKNHGIEKKGLKYVIYSTIGAVITISLFKYNITFYNSVEAEALMSGLIIVPYFFVLAITKNKQNPFLLLRKPVFLAQSLSSGLAGLFMAFAYTFAPASIITSGKRSSSIFMSVISGNHYFHEKHIVIKIITFALLSLGVALLVF